MGVFLFSFGLLAWLFAFMEFVAGSPGGGQVIGCLIGISGTVLICSGAIVEAIHEPKWAGKKAPDVVVSDKNNALKG